MSSRETPGHRSQLLGTVHEELDHGPDVDLVA
jgi:hypothetical protein